MGWREGEPPCQLKKSEHNCGGYQCHHPSARPPARPPTHPPTHPPDCPPTHPPVHSPAHPPTRRTAPASHASQDGAPIVQLQAQPLKLKGQPGAHAAEGPEGLAPAGKTQVVCAWLGGAHGCPSAAPITLDPSISSVKQPAAHLPCAPGPSSGCSTRQSRSWVSCWRSRARSLRRMRARMTA